MKPTFRVHKLKTWNEPFEFVWLGEKTFEIRKDDRGFKVGDLLYLQHWDERKQAFGDRFVLAFVTIIIKGQYGLPPDLCVMQLGRVQRGWEGSEKESTSND